MPEIQSAHKESFLLTFIMFNLGGKHCQKFSLLIQESVLLTFVMFNLGRKQYQCQKFSLHTGISSFDFCHV